MSRVQARGYFLLLSAVGLRMRTDAGVRALTQAKLEKKFRDWEFEKRSHRVWAQHLLMLLPLAVYIGVTYVELRYISITGLGITAGCYGVVSSFLYWLARRSVLREMRREGVVDEKYEPPQF